MKKFIVFVLLVSASTTFAAAPTKYGFRAISSASQVRCGVFGGKSILNKDSNGNVIQGHAPDTEYSRSYLLGTKGFANHSTAGQASVAFTCVVDGTSTTAPVKVFMNGIETYYLTTDTDTFVIGR